jgi:hypothetical protein
MIKYQYVSLATVLPVGTIESDTIDGTSMHEGAAPSISSCNSHTKAQAGWESVVYKYLYNTTFAAPYLRFRGKPRGSL